MAKSTHYRKYQKPIFIKINDCDVILLRRELYHAGLGARVPLDSIRNRFRDIYWAIDVNIPNALRRQANS